MNLIIDILLFLLKTGTFGSHREFDWGDTDEEKKDEFIEILEDIKKSVGTE